MSVSKRVDPQTTLETNYDVKGFNSHIDSKGRQLYRITVLDAWRGGQSC